MDLQTYIRQNVITAEILRFQGSVRTVETAASVLGVPTNQFGKTLLLLAGTEPLLLVAVGEEKVDLSRVAAFLGVSKRKLRLASAQEVLTITGFPVGDVPPFGHKKTIRTLVDSRVSRFDCLLLGGGDENALLKIPVCELLRGTNGTLIEL